MASDAMVATGTTFSPRWFADCGLDELSVGQRTALARHLGDRLAVEQLRHPDCALDRVGDYVRANCALLQAVANHRLRVRPEAVAAVISEMGADAPLGPNLSDLADTARADIARHLDTLARRCQPAAFDTDDVDLAMAMAVLLGEGVDVCGLAHDLLRVTVSARVAVDLDD